MKYSRFTPASTVIDNMVEVDFNKGSEQGFPQVAETLTRIGIPILKDKKLIQSCHILHKGGRYYICHFKELFALDGNIADVTDDDIARRNLIIKYLVDWNLIKVINPDKDYGNVGNPRMVSVIKFSEKNNWTLEAKYDIGNVDVNKGNY